MSAKESLRGDRRQSADVGADLSPDVRDIVLDVVDIWPDYQPTRVIELPALARQARVGRVLAKMECDRPPGNFKALGGMVAALRALARASGASRLRDLRNDVEGARPLGTEPRTGVHRQHLPTLVCASAGNHGLAVAAAARWAGTRAIVYLSESANRVRAARIEALGAQVVWVAGTYDDAVAQASLHEGLVIADTSADPDDPVVRDVMDGYGLIALELATQLGAGTPPAARTAAIAPAATTAPLAAPRVARSRPTHLFVQAGVGGLAAALASGARTFMSESHRVIVVEPEHAACVAAALVAGKPEQVEGDLRTYAEMLACGLASAPAIRVLREHGVSSAPVAEELLQQAARQLQDAQQIDTTPSGATGLAGLMHISSSETLRRQYQLNEESCVLLVITEGDVPNTATILGTS